MIELIANKRGLTIGKTTYYYYNGYVYKAPKAHLNPITWVRKMNLIDKLIAKILIKRGS